MYTQSSQMEPLYPSRTSELEDLARELVAASARLEGRLAPLVLTEIEALLRVVNSYYSNLIEGHNTHPIDIERAMHNDYSAEQDKRDLQLESRIHIEVQGKLARRLSEQPATNIASPEFLCWLHQEFYASLPERLCQVSGEAARLAGKEHVAFLFALAQIGVPMSNLSTEDAHAEIGFAVGTHAPPVLT